MSESYSDDEGVVRKFDDFPVYSIWDFNNEDDIDIEKLGCPFDHNYEDVWDIIKSNPFHIHLNKLHKEFAEFMGSVDSVEFSYGMNSYAFYLIKFPNRKGYVGSVPSDNDSQFKSDIKKKILDHLQKATNSRYDDVRTPLEDAILYYGIKNMRIYGFMAIDANVLDLNSVLAYNINQYCTEYPLGYNCEIDGINFFDHVDASVNIVENYSIPDTNLDDVFPYPIFDLDSGGEDKIKTIHSRSKYKLSSKEISNRIYVPIDDSELGGFAFDITKYYRSPSSTIGNGRLYILKSPENKFYVGHVSEWSGYKSSYDTIKKQWRKHIEEAYNYDDREFLLNEAIRYYGPENFEICAWWVTDNDISDIHLIEDIICFNSLYPNGYNIRIGGTVILQDYKLTVADDFIDNREQKIIKWKKICDGIEGISLKIYNNKIQFLAEYRGNTKLFTDQSIPTWRLFRKAHLYLIEN